MSLLLNEKMSGFHHVVYQQPIFFLKQYVFESITVIQSLHAPTTCSAVYFGLFKGGILFGEKCLTVTLLANVRIFFTNETNFA